MVLVGGPAGIESVTLDQVQDPDRMRRGRKGRTRTQPAKASNPSLPGNPVRVKGTVRVGGRRGR
jgi:hypothetical protein